MEIKVTISDDDYKYSSEDAYRTSVYNALLNAGVPLVPSFGGIIKPQRGTLTWVDDFANFKQHFIWRDNDDDLPSTWPFPVHNGKRTAASQELLDNKPKRRQNEAPDDMDDAPF